MSKTTQAFCFGLGATVLILITGCANHDPVRGAIGSYRNYKNVKGQLKEGRYISPATNFSCAIPKLLEPGAVIRDTSNKTTDGSHVGTVGFEDDLGTFYRVDWFEIQPDLTGQVPDKELFERLFNFQMRTYQQVVPKVSLEAKESTGEGADLKLFFAAFLPGGSTISNNGRRLDCTRASLIFRKGHWGYSVTTQDAGVLDDRKSTVEERKAALRSKLDKFLEGFEFK